MNITRTQLRAPQLARPTSPSVSTENQTASAPTDSFSFGGVGAAAGAMGGGMVGAALGEPVGLVYGIMYGANNTITGNNIADVVIGGVVGAVVGPIVGGIGGAIVGGIGGALL